VAYVVVFPEGLLRVRHAAGGLDLLRDADDEDELPYQTRLWSAVAEDVDPHRRQVNGLALDANLRAKVVDAADAMPDVYPVNPVATVMLIDLGGPRQTRHGTVAIVADENPETALTGSLTEKQLAIIVETHRSALGAVSLSPRRR
jgi:hypothetical protein